MEEQCMRHGVVRRSDQVPLRLVHTGQRVQGIVVADLTGGRVLGLQCKALILADGGASDLAHTGRGGHGLALALEADLPLRDMEFLAQRARCPGHFDDPPTGPSRGRRRGL